VCGWDGCELDESQLMEAKPITASIHLPFKILHPNHGILRRNELVNVGGTEVDRNGAWD